MYLKNNLCAHQPKTRVNRDAGEGLLDIFAAWKCLPKGKDTDKGKVMGTENDGSVCGGVELGKLEN